MNLTLEQRAANHFPHNPTYQAAWLRIIALLGDRWRDPKKAPHGKQN